MEWVLKNGRLCACALICVFGLAVFAARVPAQTGGQGSAHSIQALFVSDIHFEPFWDPGKAAQLAKAPVAEWGKILDSQATEGRPEAFTALQKQCHARGIDANFAVYESSLRAMHERAATARFVIVSGDLIAHDFACKFAAVFPKAAPGEYRAFVEKTLDYVLTQLRATLSGVPVYAGLGNNDSDCGDYQLDANGVFLRESGKLFAADLRGAERAQAVETFAAGGHYSVRLPEQIEHARLLVLDDVFMAERYAACSGKPDAAPAAAQLAWLKQQLGEAREKKEKLWVMAHIPPGVNAYSTATKGKSFCATGKPTMFLSSEALPEILTANGDVIRLTIFGHTHMDEMRLLAPAKESATAKPVAVKVVASISPVDGNNPSFTLATVDPETATLMDYRVIAASNQTGEDTTWNEEYDFAQTYHEPAFTAAALTDLIAGFTADRFAQKAASESYLRNYMTGVDLRGLAIIWHPYACSLDNETAEAYTGCACHGTP